MNGINHIALTALILTFFYCEPTNPTDADNLSSADTIQGAISAVIDDYKLQNHAITALYNADLGGYLTITITEPPTSAKQAVISISIPSSCLNLIGTYPILKQTISVQNALVNPFVICSDVTSATLRQFKTDSSYTGVILITECNTAKRRISGGFAFKAGRTDISGYKSGETISGTVKLENIFWK